MEIKPIKARGMRPISPNNSQTILASTIPILGSQSGGQPDQAILATTISTPGLHLGEQLVPEAEVSLTQAILATRISTPGPHLGEQLVLEAKLSLNQAIPATAIFMRASHPGKQLVQETKLSLSQAIPATHLV